MIDCLVFCRCFRLSCTYIKSCGKARIVQRIDVARGEQQRFEPHPPPELSGAQNAPVLLVLNLTWVTPVVWPALKPLKHAGDKIYSMGLLDDWCEAKYSKWVLNLDWVTFFHYNIESVVFLDFYIQSSKVEVKKYELSVWGGFESITATQRTQNSTQISVVLAN